VQEYFNTPINGKLTLTGSELPISNINIDKVVDRIQIGLHTGQPVLYDLSGSLQKVHFVDQVFTSTLNLNDYGKKSKNENIIAKTLLRAAYQGTFLSALYNGNEYLYLTLVGGGVFKKPKTIILDELVKAHNKWSEHSKSKLKKVYLCLYERDEKVLEYFK